jgi:hypothetical protein
VSNLHSRLLERAADKLGGLDEVARYLNVSDLRVRIWRRGFVAPPDDVFLRLVDLLEEPPPGRPPSRPAGKARESSKS